MIFKPSPHHKLLWAFHLEGVSTGIYLQKTGIYVSTIVQAFQLLTFSTKQVTKMRFGLALSIVPTFVEMLHSTSRLKLIH